MKTKYFNKCVALFICLVLIIINSNIKMVKADTISTDFMNNAEHLTIFDEEVISNSEIALIDKLANEYYNYYVKNGMTKEKIENMIISESYKNLLDSEMMLIDANIFQNITTKTLYETSATLDYSLLIQQVTGYTYTVNQIAAQLASIGIVMNISGALPFLDLLALVAGAVIVTIAIAIAYTVVAVAVNNLVLTWYAYSGVNLTAAKQNTEAIVLQYNNGATFWRAFLADYAGLGGILITDPINHVEATEIVKLNLPNFNVFAMLYSDAAYLATYAYGYGFTNPKAHREDGRVLNMQHVHALLNGGIQGRCHIFFALPFIV